MTEPRDVVVIGAGPNGLVAAANLARAGLKPLVLERRSIVGGASVTEEFHPGFRCSTVHATATILPEVARHLALDHHGLSYATPEARLFVPGREGSALVLYDGPHKTASALASVAPRDGQRWVAFTESLSRIARLLAPLLTTTPPSIDQPSAQDVWRMLGVGRRFRALPRQDAYRLLRWGPMAVADFAAEWFESEPLKAAIAARGIFGVSAGPWSAGTTANLLLQAAAESHPGSGGAFARGGMGAVAAAMASAARSAGAEIRTDAPVASILVRDGVARGVVLADGTEIPARAVVSGVDPKRTFLKLLDPLELDPEFLQKVRNYRCLGVVARVHLALSSLPRFSGAPAAQAQARSALSGRIHIGPEIDSLERAFDAAKYGEFSPDPYCDVTIPSLTDPDLAPAGCHVLSAHVQYAPFRLKEGDWTTRAEALGDAVVQTLESHAPGLKGAILARRVVTPLELEEVYGLTGGHIFHGEHSLDQLFTMRPILGFARYRTPIPGLYLCGGGTHPGGGVTGAPGANASREILKDWKSGKKTAR